MAVEATEVVGTAVAALEGAALEGAATAVGRSVAANEGRRRLSWRSQSILCTGRPLHSVHSASDAKLRR